MESQRDMGEREESLNNVVVGEPGEEENESKSVGESEDEPDSSHDKSSKRRKHNRPSPNQVQELEAIFKENPHPDEKSRLELARKLSMDNNQVKFWFQNKRTQVKLQLKRHETGTLRQENDKLRNEQFVLKEVMRKPICNRCNGRAIIGDMSVDEYQTKIENDRLNDEVKNIRVLAEKILGPSSSLEGSMASMMANPDLRFAAGRNGFGGINFVDAVSSMGLDFGNGMSSPLPENFPRPTTSLANKDVTCDKSKLMNLAFAAMNELLRLAEIGEPLWVRSSDGGGEILNLEEYARSFTQYTSMKPGHFITDATRASGTVINNSLTLVETLMDKNRWVEMFSCIVGKTSTIDVISSGIGGSRSGTMLLIQTEFQIISDLVPVREIKFLRFCHQHAEGIWSVVDVSVDAIQIGSQQCEIGNCRRLPSGCIVQDMHNGYSKVTWIEHMEYDENLVHHLYRPLVRTGIGFGAQRWMATLQRQSEFFAVVMSSIDPTVCSSGQRSIGMLAQRMTRNFCAGVCATIHKWEIIQLANGEDAKLIMRNNIDDPGEPIGVVLSATKTIWLPVKQQHLFEFFMNVQTRSQWDVLSSSGPMQQTIYISKGQHLNSSISLFRANGDGTGANQNNMLILQDTYTDATGSLLVYATIDTLKMNAVMNGGDSSCVTLLPSGIAIVPDYFQQSPEANNCNAISGKIDNDINCGGSLVTIGFQVLVNSSPGAKLSKESVKTVNDIISRTIHDIKTALKCK